MDTATVRAGTTTERGSRGELADKLERLATVDRLTLFLGHATPNPVGLSDGESVGSALRNDGAGGAHSLSRPVACFARGTALTFWVKERRGVGISAGAVELPFPYIGDGPGETGDVGHEVLQVRGQ